MYIIIIAAVCVTLGIVAGVIVSKKKFDNKISNVQNSETSIISYGKPIKKELQRYEQLKANLVEVRRNVEEIDIPIPERLTSMDDAESSMNKLSKYFENHSKSAAGTEAFILSILPVSQTGEAICSFASVAPDLFSDAFYNSVSALKEGATIPGIDDISTCLSKFCEGMAHTSHVALCRSLQHHDYMGALLKPVKSGIVEMSGFNDATGSLTESIHDMGNILGDATELSIDPTDMTDLDFSGHIPVMTIAISSFREFNLLMDNKTDAMTSLKNIGLDAAGAGGGGLVGAKAGALAGSFFGPLGTLLGGIVGGIGGAIGGRAMTNEIKQKPLKNAIEAYQSNANQMKSETREKSRRMLESICNFTSQKRKDFKTDNILKDIPIIENENTFMTITLILYQAVREHFTYMKQKVEKMRSSFWYSDRKYGLIVENYQKRIEELEGQLPSDKYIESNPKFAVESLLSLQIPSQNDLR